MAGTISFAGIGSGLDVEGIVTGLVNASSGNLTALQKRSSTVASATTAISDIGSYMSRLQTAVTALDDITKTKSYTATSSNSALSVSASGAALPATYTVSVERLAKEARVYSNAQASTDSALGVSGKLGLSIGGTTANLDIAATDTLNDVVSKINEAGLRVSASTFYDGSQYRLQLNGLDTGASNALTITQTGFDLGLNDSANIKQTAQDSQVWIDGFKVNSASNQIVGAMPGVTMNLLSTTTSDATIKVATDPSALQTKLQAVVDSYNNVVNKVHSVAGFGSTAATNAALAGDSTLRNLTSRLSQSLTSTVSTGTQYDSLRSIGVSLNRDGTLSLDTTKLTTAINADPASVSQVLAGTASDGSSGVMDIVGTVVKAFTDRTSGMLTNKTTSLNSENKRLSDSIAREQDRLNKYADQLRSQFQAIEGSMTESTNTMSYLTSLYG